MKHVFLFHENDPSIMEKMHDFDSKQFTWIYFGQNVLRCKDLEAKDLAGIAQFNIAAELQQTAKKLRQTYIDYVGDLLPQQNQIYWWLTSVSEKNFHISPLFLYLCYLDMGVKYANTATKNIIIVSESGALLSAIEINLRKNPTITVIYSNYSLGQKTDIFRQHIRFFIRRVFFLVRWVCRYFLSRLFGIYRAMTRKSENETKKTLLHSWVDQRSLTKGEDYYELYLGSLGRELQHRKENVIYLIDVLPTVFYPTALSCLMKKKEELYLMEEFLPLGEIFKAYYLTQANYPVLDVVPSFESYEIGDIVRDELTSDRKNTRAAQAYLCYIIGKELVKKFKVKMFVYSFENLMWEKMFCQAFNETSPTTKKIAYQHVLPSPMYLFYSISNKEKQVCPLPDLILTNGMKGKIGLIESGFDDVKITVTGPLRFLWSSHNWRGKKTDTKITVLIPTSASINETLELLTKSIAAFQNNTSITVLIKFHPTLPIGSVLNNIPKLPSTFSITNDPIDHLLNQTDIVVYTSSSVAAEAVSRGVPAVHVKSDYWIDTNILEGSDLIPSASTPDELNTFVTDVHSRGFLTRAESDSIINNLFAQVDYSEFAHYIETIETG